MDEDTSKALASEWKETLSASDEMVKGTHEQWDTIDCDLVQSHWERQINLLGDDKIQTVHLAWSDFLITLEACMSNHAQFGVTPEWGTDPDSLESQEYLCNYFARSKKVRLGRAGTRAFAEGWLYGIGIAEVGFGVAGPRIGMGDRARWLASKGLLRLCPNCDRMFTDAALAQCPECDAALDTVEAKDILALPDAERLLRMGAAWIEHRPSRLLRWDPSAPWPWESPWLSLDSFPTLTEVQSNPAFNKEVVAKLQGAIFAPPTDEANLGKAAARTAMLRIRKKRCHLRTVWIQKDEMEAEGDSWFERLVLCEETDMPLLHEANPWPVRLASEGDEVVSRFYPCRKPPIVFFKPWEIPNNPMPKGLMGLHRNLYYELSLQHTLELNHAQRELPQWLYDPELLDTETITQIAQPIPNRMIPVKGLASAAGGALQEKKRATLGAEHFMRSRDIKGLIQWVTGLSDISRAQRVDTSATQARMLGAPTLIMQSLVKGTNEFFEDAVELLMGAEAHYMTDARPFSVPGDDPRMIEREELIAPSTIETIPGSTVWENDAVLRKQMMEFANYLAQRGPGYANLQAVDRMVAARFSPFKAKLDDIFPGAQDEKIAEAENRMMFGGQAMPPSTTGNLSVHLMAHKAAFEQAASSLQEPNRSAVMELIAQHAGAEEEILRGMRMQMGGRNLKGTQESTANTERVGGKQESPIPNVTESSMVGETEVL